MIYIYITILNGFGYVKLPGVTNQPAHIHWPFFAHMSEQLHADSDMISSTEDTIYSPQ